MTVKLTPELYWLDECVDVGDEKHLHLSAYLLDTGDAHILIDTGSFFHREKIKDAIEEITGEEGPDALVISKAHDPHSANVAEFRAAWGYPDVIATSGVPDLYGLPDAKKAVKTPEGKVTEIAGRPLTFIDPPLLDVGHSTWIYDEGSKTLFTADGFGHFHGPGECNKTSNDLDGGISVENIHGFHEEMLLWLVYVKPELVMDAMLEIFDRYEIEHLAAIHGNPVDTSDIEGYLDGFERSVERISNSYVSPALRSD